MTPNFALMRIEELATKLTAANRRIAEPETLARPVIGSESWYASNERAEFLANLAAANQEIAVLKEMLLASTQRAVRWVPVSEALPATELRVLVAYNDGRMTIILRALHIPARTVLCQEYCEGCEYDEDIDATYYRCGWYEAMEEGEYALVGPLSGTVTHWARLPKLPEVQP